MTKCPKCGSTDLSKETDGKTINAMPGINYQVCQACGYHIVKNKRKIK